MEENPTVISAQTTPVRAPIQDPMKVHTPRRSNPRPSDTTPSTPRGRKSVSS